MCFKDFLMLLLLIKLVASSDNVFIFNGFLELGGVAEVRPNGLFRLTNGTEFKIGHAFYSVPFRFKNSSTANASSFSTTFVFAIVPEKGFIRGHGMAFVLAPSKGLPYAYFSQYLGLFNLTNNGDPSNHIVAVELDSFQNQEFNDIDGNHVGIDINGLTSVKAASAGYFNSETGKLTPVDLSSGERIQLWVEYDGIKHQLNVTLSPIHMSKPEVPLLSLYIDLEPIILEQMYIGFSSSTGRLISSHYVLGWSFKINGKAEGLDLAKLPSLPAVGKSVSKDQIAVKRISHKSNQGMKEFIAEIGTIGRLRHPNLLPLLGYC